MRPKKSPAPGWARSSRASATTISMYSCVISSAAPSPAAMAVRRRTIASRQRWEWTRCRRSSGRSGKSSDTGPHSLPDRRGDRDGDSDAPSRPARLVAQLAEQDERPTLQHERTARGDDLIHAQLPAAGVDLDAPLGTPPGIRHRELERLVPGVDAQHERVVDDLLAPPAWLGDAPAVEEDHERAGGRGAPALVV